MPGNIKIDLDLPDFENELNISVTLKRDGKSITYSSTPSGAVASFRSTESNPIPTTPPREVSQLGTTKMGSGNGSVIETMTGSSEGVYAQKPPYTPPLGGNCMNISL